VNSVRSSDRERFLRSFHTRGECWEWEASCFERGYGQFKVGEKNWLAHRFSYTIFVGPIPKGMLICHTCDNRKCVRPSHLFPGTHRDNSDDKIQKGRSRRSRGSAKIDMDAAKRIRHLYLTTHWAQENLALDFGVSRAAVQMVLAQKTWPDGTPPIPRKIRKKF